MSILDALRSGVKVVDKITKPLQPSVFLEHSTGSGAFGAIYAAPVSLRAIIDEKQQQVRTQSGVLAASRAQITFLDIAALVTALGENGRIKENDIITMPDGTKGSVLAVGGFVDAGNGSRIPSDVWIG